MDSLITLCIFIIILFMYIHIANQFKLSDEMEIYETDYQDPKHLEDVCELKQPVLFHVKNVFPSLFSDIVPEKIAQFGSHDVHLKDYDDYFQEKQQTVDPILLPLNTSISFIENDQHSHLFSENNQEFLEETNLIQKLKKAEPFIKPPLTVTCKYDLYFGSANCCTPFRYHNNNRNFLCVTHGNIKVKMTPWKSRKFLHVFKDYENYEFRSLVSPRNIQDEFKLDFNKTSFIEFDVKEGQMLYVPPYWFYNIQYSNNPANFVCSFNYSSLINHISNLKDLCLYFLQQQNITKRMDNKKELILEESIKNEIVNKDEQLPKEEVPKEDVIIEKEDKNEKPKEKESKKEETPRKKPKIVDISKKNENITYEISNI